jgi:H+-translocating NAD(P) transhydrogenase subunit alpha
LASLIDALFIFMLAAFIGFEVIRRISPLLHTPLMSLTNALDAIAVLGAIILVGEHRTAFSAVLGFIAVVAATSNVVGGFVITDRMLKMFKSSRPTKP